METEEVPAVVEAMDGIESEDEAHNADRPARQSLQKKRPTKGKPLSEFAEGSMVTGKVRSITTYGAFIDIGAATDGLLHISQLASGFVADVSDVLKEGQELEVRIVRIDAEKNQVGLSMMSQQEASESEANASSRPKRAPQNNRRDDSPALALLSTSGWDTSVFVEGTVVSTVAFGCFVRIDTKTLNSECEGEVDGLVHISALTAGRVNTVTDIVKVDQKVQVRVKSIDGSKISLTMVSVEDEAKAPKGGGGGRGGYDNGPVGALDWKESLAKYEETAPKFTNAPFVTDNRK
jgi:predicted RNA-binding protein with RPS1 domain